MQGLGAVLNLAHQWINTSGCSEAVLNLAISCLPPSALPAAAGRVAALPRGWQCPDVLNPRTNKLCACAGEHLEVGTAAFGSWAVLLPGGAATTRRCAKELR